MRPCKRCGAPIEGKILRKRIVHCQPCSSQLAGANNKRHGWSETREYAAWTAMRERCNNPKAHNYHRYGARGIRVCERWDSFENFIADMARFPIVVGSTYWQTTHHWRGLADGETVARIPRPYERKPQR